MKRTPPATRRLETDGLVLAWGDKAQAKAELREESLRRHMERPLSERLAAALALVVPVSPEDLLIHKLIKLRSDKRRVLQDAADIRAVIDARIITLDREYLRRWLPSAEADLVESAPSLADDDLVGRLMKL